MLFRTIIIAAICAIPISAWEKWETNREKGRWPVLSIKLNYDAVKGSAGIYLKNNGASSIRIKEMYPSLDDQPLSIPLEVMLPGSFTHGNRQYQSASHLQKNELKPGCVLQQEEEITYLEFNKHNYPALQFEHLKQLLQRINLLVVYENLSPDGERLLLVEELVSKDIVGSWRGNAFLDKEPITTVYTFNPDRTCLQVQSNRQGRTVKSFSGNYLYRNFQLSITWGDGQAEFGAVQWSGKDKFHYHIISPKDPAEVGFKLSLQRTH